MNFFKALTYFLLIGFVIDLLSKFFNTSSITEHTKYFGLKSTLTLVLFVIIVMVIGHFNGLNSGFNWFFILLVPFLIAATYYANQHLNKKALEDLKKSKE